MSSVTCGSRDFLTIEAMFWAVSRGKGRSCPLHRHPCRLRVGETRPKSRPPPANRRRLSGSVRNRPAFRLALPLAGSSPASTPSCESVAKPMRLPPLSPKSAPFSMVENHCRNRFRKMLLYECRPGVSRFSSDGGKQPHTPIHGFFSGIKHNILGRNSV